MTGAVSNSVVKWTKSGMCSYLKSQDCYENVFPAKTVHTSKRNKTLNLWQDTVTSLAFTGNLKFAKKDSNEFCWSGRRVLQSALLRMGTVAGGSRKERRKCSWISSLAWYPVIASGLIPHGGTRFPCRNNTNMISLEHRNSDVHNTLFCISIAVGF